MFVLYVCINLMQVTCYHCVTDNVYQLERQTQAPTQTQIQSQSQSQTQTETQTHQTHAPTDAHTSTSMTTRSGGKKRNLSVTENKSDSESPLTIPFNDPEKAMAFKNKQKDKFGQVYKIYRKYTHLEGLHLYVRIGAEIRIVPVTIFDTR